MPRDAVKRLAWTSLVLALVTLAALTAINAHLRNEVAPQGIVSFELCAYHGSCVAMLESWGADARVWAGLSLGLDYLFMLIYAAAIFLALRLLALRLPRRWARPTRAVAWSAWAAALMDAAENYCLARLLLEPTAEGCAWPAAIFATIKFMLVAVALMWLVVGWCMRSRTGPA
jgi:hypothetical protein